MQKADAKLVVVKNIENSFGVGSARVLAYVYASEAEMKSVEPQKRAKAGGEKEKPRKKEASSEKKEASEKEEGSEMKQTEDPSQTAVVTSQ